MAFPNPAINPPFLSYSSSRPRLHSRSPPRSPVRQPRDFDPLLRDLSPTTTLRAFTTADDSTSKHDSAQSALAHSFETASTSERALGVKAAQTCLDLRSWTRELESWGADWPGTFDVPEPARKRIRMSRMSMLSVRTVGEEDGEEEELWGCLPGKTVQAYEQRAEDIGQAVEKLDVEELKVFVLAAHRQAGDGRVDVDDSVGAIGAHTDLRRLDDFTALITATILQALPYLSRLHRLLEIWSIRLSVLRQTPSYLHDLKQARTDLDHGWAAIAVSPSSGNFSSSSANFTRDNMHEMKNIIDQEVGSLGKRLDSFLDELEGREETVPETWIEDFETLESAYGDWVVQAERKVLEKEWRVAREEQERDAERAKAEQQLTAPQPKHERKVSSSSFDVEDHSRDRNSLVVPSSRPTSGIFDLTTEQPMLELPRPSEQPREDSQTLPEGDTKQIQHPQGPTELPAASPITQQPPVASPTKRHARHMPIVIDYSNPEQVHPSQPQQQASPLESTPKENLNPSTHPTPLPTNVAKKRAAFLNQDVERAESLQRQVKSPVRSFEHASNAFTRLFKKDSRDKTPEQLQGRSNSHRSTISQNSGGSKRDSGSKRNSYASTDGVIWGGRKHASTGTPAIGESASGSASKRASLDTREAYIESRTASQRSSASKTADLRGAVVDVVPIAMPRQKSFQRDYMDIPRGFRSRSSSEGSRRTAKGSLTPGRFDYDGLERRLERLPEVGAPVETYQPSRRRLSSPFDPSQAQGSGAKAKEQDYPADWPLASPPETVASSPVKEVPGAFTQEEDAAVGAAEAEKEEDDGSPEIHSPRAPLDTDAFDRIFVESLPATPEPEFEGNPLARVASPPPRRRSILGSMGMDRRESARSQVPTLDESMLGAEEERWSPRLPGEEEVKSAGSMNAGRSEGDVRDAGYFHGQPAPPQQLSGTSSSPTARAQGKNGFLTTGPKSLKLQIPGSPATAPSAAGEAPSNDAEAPALAKPTCSTAPQSPASSPTPGAPSAVSSSRVMRGTRARVDFAPSAVGSSAGRVPGSPSPLNYKGLIVFPTPPGHLPNVNGGGSRSRPVSPVSPISRQQSPGRTQLAAATVSEKQVEEKVPDSPVSARSDNEDSPAPLNAAMGKRQGKARPSSSKAATAASTPTNKKTNKKPATPLKPGEDTFDRHVSEVLDRLPSHAIKFKARPGAVTPVHPNQRTAEPRNYSGPRPGGAARMASRNGGVGGEMSGGGLTLAPAEASPKKAATAAAADEVKLYHLRQAGREEPIKLFVRLVGEGERVMVRVGGGWADLAEYLRQYAEHHGSRTVSGGGGIELQTAESGGGGAGGRKVSGSTTTAGAGEAGKGRAGPGTPATPAATAAAAAVPPRRGSKAAEMNWFKLDDSPAADGDDNIGGAMSPVQTPPHATTTTALPTDLAAPKSTRSTKSTSTRPGSSRPSTADSATRPGSRQNQAQSQSQNLAGRSAAANSKRSAAAAGDPLPEQKARWVEGMIEKALAASGGGNGSAEKRGDKEGEKGRYFGELGRAGGTRRMIFRQSSTGTGTGAGAAHGGTAGNGGEGWKA
ncbi:hypothetical protein B0A55_08885 [Friedmanniomyces simplex]|uniref:GAR domain-containing protein n=1 Tax=Friedmanniomyces simplex TaxID=329884 RepID=A0A4U0XBS1_9PEZI|nr:hypothetical protein B0A55_08885 [Friedmanniomyces simplex]